MPKRQLKGLRLRDGVLPENQRQVWEAVRGLQCDTRSYRAKYSQWSRLGNRDETKIPRINLRPQNLLENKYTQPPHAPPHQQRLQVFIQSCVQALVPGWNSSTWACATRWKVCVFNVDIFESRSRCCWQAISLFLLRRVYVSRLRAVGGNYFRFYRGLHNCLCLFEKKRRGGAKPTPSLKWNTWYRMVFTGFCWAFTLLSQLVLLNSML